MGNSLYAMGNSLLGEDNACQPSPGRLRPPPSYRATTPTSSMGLLRLTGIDFLGNRRDGPYLGADARGRLATAPGARDAALGASQPQESILGPISMTINISMNNGDSDAMDNRR